MKRRLHGINTIGVQRASAALGLQPFRFDLGAATFAGALAIRPMDTFYSPIIQGNWDGTGTPDVVTYPRGDRLGNQTQVRYANFDPYQGSIVFWITPEFVPGDGVDHQIWNATNHYIWITAAGLLQGSINGISVSVDVTGWNAGTTYCVVFRWDTKAKLDSTNYGCMTINDVHTFGDTTVSSIAIGAILSIGSHPTVGRPANALIEGLHVFNRVLFDGTYGIDVGNGDEIALIAAGTDPMIVTKGIGAVTGFPTDCGTELDTGADHMWAWPRASNIPDIYDMWDGGLPGTPYCVEFNGTSTYVDCGSGATLDDIPAAGGVVQVGIWIRIESITSTETIIGKGSQVGGAFVGWHIRRESANLRFYVQTGNTLVNSTIDITDYANGKYYYILASYDDTAKVASLSIAGRWGADSAIGGGVYTTDAAYSLYMGRRSDAAGLYYTGGVAWTAIWDAEDEAPGTDFIPPRTAPAPGGNLVESWHMDEGTGATAAAQVTSPANDGTITNGTWSSIWNVVGTPVVPQSHTFDGSATAVDCLSPAVLDNIPAGANGFTVNIYARLVGLGGGNLGRLVDKGTWRAFVYTAGIEVYIAHAGADALSTVAFSPDNLYHDITLFFRSVAAGGDGKIYIAIDGIWATTYAAQIAGGGAVTDDSAQTLYIGNNVGSSRSLDGAMAFFRISDNDRNGHGVQYVPFSRVNPPGVDGNTVVQYNFTDGAGTTLTDAVGPGTNNGTITPGDGIWLNTPDMEQDEPGARLTPNGYNIGSDAADDGIGTTEVVTAETDYAVFGLINVGADGHGWPYLYVYDNTNAAQIGANYYLPRLTDVHTGANNSATLINANGHFTQHLVGWTLYNITDGSETVVTAVSGDGTQATGVLAGGTDNDWDANDVHLFRAPRHYSRHPFGVDLNFVFRTPAGCTSIDIEIRNEEGAGVLAVHSLQVLESAFDNGDMESLQNNGGTTGFQPTGATDNGLDVGDSIAEAAIIHSGAQSLEFAVGASAEGFYESAIAAIPQDSYYMAMAWGYSVDGVLTEGAIAAANGPPQYDPTANALAIMPTTDAFWTAYAAVRRQASATQRMSILASAGAGGLRYLDDLGYIPLDAVTLTVTPANQANSLEGTGIRVDGLDDLQQGIGVGYFRASEGHFRFPITFRHDDADLAAFGNATPYLAQTNSVGGCYISVLSAANTITLTFDDGGGAHTANWATGGALAEDIKYTVDVIYTPSWMRLYIDNVQRIEITQPINFTSIPTIMFWGSDNAGTSQIDAVIG